MPKQLLAGGVVGPRQKRHPRFRGEAQLRRRWAGYLGLVLIIGLTGGVALGAGTAAFAAPDLVAYVRTVGLPARLLYAPIVEELTLRGGLLTLIAWAISAATRAPRPPKAGVLAPAIVLSNAAFAIGHVFALRLAHVSNPWWSMGIIFVVALPWGWLFWRHGFESAVAAHASFHVTLELARILG